MLDWLIAGGEVVDGTGGPAFRADVGLAGDRIRLVNRNLGGERPAARRVVDARGRTVCPGFIDVHSHSEFGLLRGDCAEARLRQGVTTDLMSPDGFAYAPLSPARRTEMAEYLEVFNGAPEPDWKWGNLAEYLALFDGRIAVNLVPQAGFNAIRAEAAGWDARPAGPDEIRRMQDLTREAMEQGARDLQTGLDYHPSGHASFEELAATARTAASYGGAYVSHVRGVRGDVEAGVAEALRVGREADAAVRVSHLFGSEALYETLSRAHRGGMDVAFDAYPYMAASSHLGFCLPRWLDRGPPRRIVQTLSDPETQARAAPRIESFFRTFTPHPGRALFSALPEGPHRDLEGRPLTELPERMGKPLGEAVCELLAQCRLRVLMIYRWEDEGKLRRALTHPLGMVGSDGLFRGGRPHPRGFGAHARMLAYAVREKGWLSLEEAVHRMTGVPAARYRLADRGEVAPGRAADLLVFRPELIQDRADFVNGRALAAGMEYAFVNGRAAIADGRLADLSAGRVLRR